MSRINVDFIAFDDPRFTRLAKLLGLADGDHARSKVEYLWRDCTLRHETDLPMWLVEERLGPKGPEALIESELARWSGGRGDSTTRRMYIRGSKARTRWLGTLAEQSSNGGKSRARSASREAGKFTSAPTPAPSPAPTPADLQTPIVPKGTDLSSVASQVSRERPRPQSRKSGHEPTAYETAVARVVLDKLSEQSGAKYSGASSHVRMIADRLREGVSETDLRFVVGFCAIKKGWADDDKFRDFLRPETLFESAKKLGRYLDQARSWGRQQEPIRDLVPRPGGES